ncbi:MAG: MFS transporter, partial [Propionibacterium sp.]|nr:MFS transporter [Propionibacterium sp.]
MSTATADTPAYSMGPAERRVFIGLVLGMAVAAISQTIVGPAMPRIVSELGGMEHYSWVPSIAMLLSAITVPIVGKLSDMYGRRFFFLAGLVVFLTGTLLSGVSPNFWFLVFARGIQGIGMGTLMPLSQTILGDIVPPRFRGKYQGYMGAVFGLASVAGPLAGGALTDAFGWRVLFFATLPFGVIAFFAVARFLQMDHTPSTAKVDWPGIAVLSLAITAILIATSTGGSTWAWTSWQILTLFGVGLLLLGVFVLIERRAEAPVIPLRLWRNPIFTLSNLSGFGVAMMMFGAIMYAPVFAQGALGANATESGVILMPLNIVMIGMGIVVGLLITRTGRYKPFMLVGLSIMAFAFWLLSRMGVHTPFWQLGAVLALFGFGLGLCMQIYLLIVQNASMRRDLGVATATTQFMRTVGSTVGVALFGAIMTARIPGAISRHVPSEMADEVDLSKLDAGSVLDPASLAGLPPEVVEAVRSGVAEALTGAFWWGIPLGLVVLALSFFIKELPLRETVHTADEARQEYLDQMGQTSADMPRVPLGRDVKRARTSERVLGLQYDLLVDQAMRGDRPLLTRAITDLGDG